MNNTQTIVDLEAKIEPTRPSYKHLQSGFRVVFLLTLNQNSTKKKKKSTKPASLRAPLLIANDLLLFTLKTITSLRQNSDQKKLVYKRLLKIVRWGLLM